MNDRLNEATADLGRAILRLRLEGDEDLIARYSEIQSLWWEYADLLVAKDDPRRFGKIAGTLEKLNPHSRRHPPADKEDAQ